MAMLSVVVPAYNEEDGIFAVLTRIIAACSDLTSRAAEIDGFEVIVVNDGSSDSTPTILASFPGIRLLHHSPNRGYGAALKTGFAAARGEYIGFLDADGTYPPECIADLVRTAIDTRADMVVGSRMGDEADGMPLVRKIGNRAFAILLSWIVNEKISDTASGMRIIKRDALACIEPLPDGLSLTPAMSTIALHEGLKVVEVPIPYGVRVGGSKLSVFADGWRFFKAIWGAAETYNPLKFFGAVGIGLVGLAFFLGVSPAIHYLMFREVPLYQIYRLVAVLVLTLTGLNVVTFGIVANHVVATVRKRPVADHWLTRIVEPRRLRNLDRIGLVLMASAVLLNAPAAYNYLTTFRVGVHWSYVLTGAFLFLTGTHFFMVSRLACILEFLSANQEIHSDTRFDKNSHGSGVEGEIVPRTRIGA